MKAPDSLSLLKKWCAQQRSLMQTGHPSPIGLLEHIEATENLISQVSNRNRLRDLESLITGHIDAMRPLLTEWHELRNKRGT